MFKSWTAYEIQGEVGGVRILGVLQRIALCYFFASVIIYYAKVRGAFLISCLLLLLYWGLCIALNPSDPYSLKGWFGTAIDKQILGAAHMYRGEGVAFDPEGIMSTLPAIVQVIFGFLAGDYILKRGKNTPTGEIENTQQSTSPVYQTLTVLFIAAVALLFTGYAWGLSFPINKKIWTSSYVAYTLGLAIAVLATLVYFVEVRNVRGGWTRFFDAFGKNALFIYALSGVIPDLLSIIHIGSALDANGVTTYITPWNWFYENVTAKVPGPPENGSLLFALCFVFLLWGAYRMDKKNIYIKV